jgi:pimeloyl-ACP methyl ester carboxylesterase
MGAYVAFAYALRYRDVVAALVTIDAPPPGTTMGDALSANPRTWHIPFHANVDVAHFLISGRERDYIDYFIASRIYEEMTENGHLEIVPEAGHWIPEEHPDRLAAIILATAEQGGAAL